MLKDDLADPEDALENLKRLDRYDVKLGSKPAFLYTKRSDLHLPGWAHFLEDVIDVDRLRLQVRSSSALLLVEVKKRAFGIAFGYGRHFLRSGTFEERFGLYVTLNAVDRTRIRAMDRDSLDVVGRHTREQLGRDSDLTEFGVDIEKDLLRAVSGVPGAVGLAKRLTGSDALSIIAEVTPASLPDLLARLLKLFGQKKYLEHFSWVDHIRAVRDKPLQRRLDDKLVARLRRSELNRTWLSIPDVISWEEIKEFRYSDSSDARGFQDVHFSTYFDEKRVPATLTMDQLKRDKISGIRASDEVAFLNWPVFKCIYTELDEGKNKYVLNAGQWYRVDKDFVSEIESDVARIPSASLTLPPYEHRSEAEYNEDVAKRDPRTFTHCDVKLISHGAGRSRIEFCDLFSKDRQLIHVKRYAGSGVLSHLFNQGLVAGELTMGDASFRRKVNAQLPVGLQFNPPEDRPDPKRLEIVYGIVSTSAKPVTLPFFSKVVLRSIHRSLTNTGLRVSLAQIPNTRK